MPYKAKKIKFKKKKTNGVETPLSLWSIHDQISATKAFFRFFKICYRSYSAGTSVMEISLVMVILCLMTYINSESTLHISWSILVNFEMEDLHILLLSSCEFYENQYIASQKSL